MRPANLKTKIFLDEGDPKETKEIINLYKKVAQEISVLIPDGSVSIQVYADKNTKAEEMLKQGKEMYQWIPNAHIKYPMTLEGLKAAEESVKLGVRINMTLVFSQQQAAAIYSATSVVTLPFKIIQEWSSQGMPTAKSDYIYPKNNLQDIPYQQLDLFNCSL